MTAFWYSIPAVAAVHAGGSIFLFCNKLRRFHKYMGFTLVFEGIFLVLAWMLRVSPDIFRLPAYLLYILTMLMSPVFYYFASRSFLREEGVKGKDFWMLEAAGLIAVVILVVAGTLEPSDRNAFFSFISGRISSVNTTGTRVMSSLDNLAWALFLFEQIFVQIFCFVNLARYNRLLESYYSNKEGKSSGTVMVIFILITVRFLYYIGMNFLPMSMTSALWFLISWTAVFCLFYAVVAFFVCNVRYSAEELAGMTEEHSEAPSRPQVSAANDAIASRLDRLVEEKFYLDPNVDVFEISSKIKVNSKYVADFIRTRYGETFLCFVNRLRVEHAVSLMMDRSINLIDVAEQSGFTSQSTFYRNFIKVKGISPSEFKKNSL